MNFKRIKNLLSTGFIGLMVLLLGVSALLDAVRDLKEFDRFDGEIVAKGITPHSTRTARGVTMTSNVFYLRLKDLDQNLAVFDRGDDYALLDASLQVGDRVRVYFRHSYETNKLNLDTYQIEKAGTVILRQEKQRNRQWLLAGITIPFGLALVVVAYLTDRAIRKEVVDSPTN